MRNTDPSYVVVTPTGSFILCLRLCPIRQRMHTFCCCIHYRKVNLVELCLGTICQYMRFYCWLFLRSALIVPQTYLSCDEAISYRAFFCQQRLITYLLFPTDHSALLLKYPLAIFFYQQKFLTRSKVSRQ